MLDFVDFKHLFKFRIQSYKDFEKGGILFHKKVSLSCILKITHNDLQKNSVWSFEFFVDGAFGGVWSSCNGFTSQHTGG